MSTPLSRWARAGRIALVVFEAALVLVLAVLVGVRIVGEGGPLQLGEREGLLAAVVGVLGAVVGLQGALLGFELARRSPVPEVRPAERELGGSRSASERERAVGRNSASIASGAGTRSRARSSSRGVSSSEVEEIPAPGDSGASAEPAGSPGGPSVAGERGGGKGTGETASSRPDRSGAPAPSLERLRESLVTAWQCYRSEGDGHFTAAGFARQAERAGLGGRVVPGEELGLGSRVLAYRAGSDERLLLVPSFNLSPRAVEPWFAHPGAAARTARVRRLVRPALVQMTPSGAELVEPGEVS